MQTGGKLGMRTMDRCLQDLVRAGKISAEVAIARAKNLDDLSIEPRNAASQQ
jgi:Tfp pilus assembly pilus retraction ATPase PilT